MNLNITNREFLLNLFDERLAAGESVWVCGLTEDPAQASRAWAGLVWNPQEGRDYPTTALPSDLFCNYYFSLASFRSAQGGRKADNATASVALILDDVGTKALLPDDLLPPTWVIETSPGNHQVGYAFVPAITDLALAKRFFQALAQRQGLTDPGGQSPVRYARLPNGFNTKAKYRQEDGSYPATRLLQWHPANRYRPEDLAERLGLTVKGLTQPLAHTPTEEVVFTDVLPENPVLTRLRESGLYKCEKAPLTHEITCPWVAEHTGQADNGTVYFEPTPEYPLGGFKCHHGHCAQRTLRDLCQQLGVALADAGNKPLIKIVGGDLHRIVERGEELLHHAGYYQNGGVIIAIQSHRTTQGAVLATVVLDAVSATVELTRLARWLRRDSRTERWITIDAPPKHATALINATQRRWLRPVKALSRQPFLRLDGTLCRSPGYDPDSQIYADFAVARFPDIPERPTREEAARALELLNSLLKETPFKSPVDHSAAVSMFISAAVRPALPTCPGFLINAHASGSGKSYLQDQAGAFATAETPLPSAAFIANDEELRKELLSKLLGGPAVIKWDEMKSDLLPVKALLSALSSELIEGRRLGSSQIIQVSTRTLMLFAGNNVYPVDDMTRRVISIHLDPAMEDPATREFARDPLTELHRERGRYIMAALTLIRAWQVAGKPVTPGVKATVNGYHQWNDWCRLPLLWLGYPDPATNLFEALKTDPAKEELLRVMETWAAAFGNAATSVKQAIQKSESDELLREALLEVAEGRPGEIDRKKLGYYLKRSQGRRVLGRFFELDKSAVRNSNRYVLRLIEAAPDPAPASPQPVLPSLTNSPAEATRSDSSDSSDSASSGLPAPAIAEPVSVRVPLPSARGQGESSHPSANPPGSGTKLPPIEGFEV